MSPSEVTPHLLVGVDFSAPSRLALDEARSLARRLDVWLYVLHVGRSSGEGDPLNGPALRWLESVDISLEMLWIRYGRPDVELARAAAQSRALALVVGSHGQSGFQSLALGSTAAGVGLIAPCPVIIVNARSADRSSGPAGGPPPSHLKPPSKDYVHAWLPED